MIQIYIDNKLVDLDNTNISLQKEFEDEVENIPSEIEYSYTVSIPATLNNKEIFEFVDTFDVANKFKRLYNADLYVDEQLILSGKFKVTSIEDGYYKGNIYNPKKKTVSEILGDRNLNEIIPHYKPMNSLSDFDKINNYVCDLSKDNDRLPNEWNNTTHPETADKNADVKDNHVVFPYVLYGLPMNIPEEVSVDADIYTQDLQYGKHSITEDKIYPSFNVVSVLKDIFKTEGYNLTGNIIDGNMKDFFGGLYQTFQYSYNDYVKNKEVPFYCKVSGSYTNHDFIDVGEFGVLNYAVPSTLELMELWSTDSWRCEQGDDVDHDGKFYYGVDNPWSAGSKGGSFANISTEDEKHMFVRGTEDEQTGTLIIPKSGWYKIKLKGRMTYPLKNGKRISGVSLVPGIGYVYDESAVGVGGTQDEADCTDLSEQPFEIQLKKGYPKEHSTLYSFNSFVPCVPTDYIEDNSVAMEEHEGQTYIKIQPNENQRRYGKNGKTTYINDYSGFQTNDFICGARLGGAWFSSQWTPAGHGNFQRKNRMMAMGAGLALPDPTKAITIKQYNDEPLSGNYKAGQGKFDGTYFQIASKNSNATNEYAEKTAQCLVRKDSYSNFEGYNTLKKTNDTTYSWDTTSNFGAVQWEGAESSSAFTYDKWSGDWDVNTCVYLEQGDTLYLEVLVPLHTAGSYRHSTAFRASKWEDREDWVNGLKMSYTLLVGFLNSNKDWKPKPDDGIATFDGLAIKKLTNVNQFLPTTKCNDYVEKFLKTFNLQITRVDSNTFSIDTINGGNLIGNVIDIDKMCNIDDAEFKPLKSDSIKEYKWKIDNTETGYAQGNQSPYMSGHGESISSSTYYQSGYTGSEIIENDLNSSGSSKKTEAPWSYNWYKSIHFLHNYTPTPITEEYADISVISESDLWKDGMTFAAGGSETPQTSKTMRLFTLKKNQEMRNNMYSYISFKYDESPIKANEDIGALILGYKDMVCNLVLPSNYYETYDIDNSKHRLHLDYKIMNNNYDGRCYNQSLMDVFFNKNVQGGYDIEVPIKLSNADYAATKQGTLYKLHDGLYRVKSIEGHDVNKKNNATLTLTTLK